MTFETVANILALAVIAALIAIHRHVARREDRRP